MFTNDTWIEVDGLRKEKTKTVIQELEGLTHKEWKELTVLFQQTRRGHDMKVVNRRNSKFDVYIGRGSMWGNPFEIGRDGTREEVCAKYYGYLMTNDRLLNALHTLVGKRLGCFCAPKLCHGDIIIHVMRMRGLLDG